MYKPVRGTFILLVAAGVVLALSGRVSAQVNEGASMDSQSAALQYLMQALPGVAWQPDGLMIGSDDQDAELVQYHRLEVAVNHYFPFGAGPEQLFVGTAGLLGTGYRLYSGSYDQNKELWDKAIVALELLGVHPETPGGADRDIRRVRTRATVTSPPKSNREAMQRHMNASRPSFDCSKAKSASARLICADAELSTLDARLGSEFKTNRERLGSADRQSYIREQLNWIQSRNQKCGLVGKDNVPIRELQDAKQCMVDVLKARIVELTPGNGGNARHADIQPAGAKASSEQLRVTDVDVMPQYIQTVTACPGCSGAPQLQGYFTELNFKVKSNGVTGSASCTDPGVIPIRIEDDVNSAQMMLDDVGLAGSLNLIRQAAWSACQSGWKAGIVHDLYGRPPRELIPNFTVYAMRGQFQSLKGYANGLTSEWVITENLVKANELQRQAIVRAQQEAQRQHDAAAQEIAKHSVDVSGPFSGEVYQCVRAMFPKMGFSAPGIQGTPCSDYIGLWSINTLDSRDIPGGIEVLTNVTVKATQSIAAGSLIAASCGIINPVRPGDAVTTQTRIQFEKWNSGLRCTSQHY